MECTRRASFCSSTHRDIFRFSSHLFLINTSTAGTGPGRTTPRRQASQTRHRPSGSQTIAFIPVTLFRVQIQSMSYISAVIKYPKYHVVHVASACESIRILVESHSLIRISFPPIIDNHPASSSTTITVCASAVLRRVRALSYRSKRTQVTVSLWSGHCNCGIASILAKRLGLPEIFSQNCHSVSHDCHPPQVTR
jgi:hypothetical protein